MPDLRDLFLNNSELAEYLDNTLLLFNHVDKATFYLDGCLWP